MKIEGNIFAGFGIFVIPCTAVYWHYSKDPTGTTRPDDPDDREPTRRRREMRRARADRRRVLHDANLQDSALDRERPGGVAA